jgi:hypothetical protein
MANNGVNTWQFHRKLQLEYFLPSTPLPLRLLQRTLDAVVLLNIMFSPLDSSSSLSTPNSVDDLTLNRIHRTGYAIFIQSELTVEPMSIYLRIQLNRLFRIHYLLPTTKIKTPLLITLMNPKITIRILKNLKINTYP